MNVHIGHLYSFRLRYGRDYYYGSLHRSSISILSTQIPEQEPLMFRSHIQVDHTPPSMPRLENSASYVSRFSRLANRPSLSDYWVYCPISLIIVISPSLGLIRALLKESARILHQPFPPSRDGFIVIGSTIHAHHILQFIGGHVGTLFDHIGQVFAHYPTGKILL